MTGLSIQSGQMALLLNGKMKVNQIARSGNAESGLRPMENIHQAFTREGLDHC